jgi:hypothetical protein
MFFHPRERFFYQNSGQKGVSTSLAGYDINALAMAMGEMASSFRNRELEWRRTHREILKSFENEWVVLEGEEIIAHGRNPIEVVGTARSMGIKIPYVFHVDSFSEDISKMGL